jgi:hypothetical integral membrane protein (TIGR02206 family)
MSVTFYPQIIDVALFSVEHISTLLVIMTLGVCLFLFRQTLFTRYFLAGVLLIGELGYQVGMLVAGKWSAQSSLPLQASDVAALLAAVMLLTRSRSLAAILYFAGIGSAVQALVTPDLGASFPQLHFLQFFATHGATVLACLYMIAVERVRPAYRSLWFAAGWLNLYAALIFVVNRMIGANYLYLMRKPDVSVLNWLGPWPWYLLWVEVLMLVEFHLIYCLVRRRKKVGRCRK